MCTYFYNGELTGQNRIEHSEFVEMRNKKNNNKGEEIKYYNEKRSFVIVLPDKREYFKEIIGGTQFKFVDLAEEAVRNLDLKSKTHDVANVDIYALSIQNGLLIRNLVISIPTKIPKIPMSFEEYNYEKDVAYASIPKEFHRLAAMSLEELHVTYEKEVRILNDFCKELKTAIKNFTDYDNAPKQQKPK